MGGVRRKSGKHLAYLRVFELAEALGWLRGVKRAQRPEWLAQGRAAVPYALLRCQNRNLPRSGRGVAEAIDVAFSGRTPAPVEALSEYDAPTNLFHQQCLAAGSCPRYKHLRLWESEEGDHEKRAVSGLLRL